MPLHYTRQTGVHSQRGKEIKPRTAIDSPVCHKRNLDIASRVTFRAHGADAYGEKARRRRAASVCRLRHDQMEQGPTEPHAGRSTFLLSSGGAGGGYF